MPIEPGYAVTPNIKLVRELGEGGMGAVWIAEHTTLHTEVAVKFILDEMATETSLKRFSREASLAAQIKSPHVVQTYDHGATDEGTPYIVMELLEGESLQARLKRGPMNPRKVAMVMAQVSKALLKAHDLEIVHRDLKPANLFLVESGYEVFVKVLDFGIAKQTGEVAKKTAVMTSELTGARAAIGTPYYMSPEALRASAELDYRADLWSLAVVAYHSLTGQLPFKADTFGDLLVLVLEERFKPPSHYIKIPEDMDSFFRRAFARKIEDRFQNAGQLARAFRGAIGAANSSHSFEDSGPVTSVPDEMLETSAEITGEVESSTAEFAPTAEGESAEGFGLDDATKTVTPDGSDAIDAATNDAKSSATLERANTEQSFAGAPPANRTPIYVAAGLAVAVGGYFAFGRGAPEPVKPEPTQQPAAAPAPSPEPAPQPTQTAEAKPTATVEAAPAEVGLTIDSIPPRVEVKMGDDKLGSAPGPIKLPKADGEVELTFSSPGYLPTKIKVKPDKDQTVEVRLKRPQRAQPKGGGLEW